MIDFTEVSSDGEVWELFARDFLRELGFFIESAPDRGADGGKDILVTEDLKGFLGNYRFRWLVSCKHFASSKKSVQEKDEQNILERLEAFKADGFIGVYSTVPATGLNTRLNDLKKNQRIKDFKIFDYKLIENYLTRLGYANLLHRYFPNSYIAIKPLHLITDQYVPLRCDSCGKDVLEALYRESYKANIVFVETFDDKSVGSISSFSKVYVCCKGRCDEQISQRYTQPTKGLMTLWTDVSDVVIPALFLDWIFTHMNEIRSGTTVYSEQAYEQLKTLILAIAQKVLREMTEQEKQRARTVLSMGPL